MDCLREGVSLLVYGKADQNSARPVTEETMFQAASISKTITALAAMLMVQDGRLQLDGDINEVLKSWKVPSSRLTAERKVTLRELLSHTAGISVGGFHGYR